MEPRQALRLPTNVSPHTVQERIQKVMTNALSRGVAANRSRSTGRKLRPEKVEGVTPGEKGGEGRIVVKKGSEAGTSFFKPKAQQESDVEGEGGGQDGDKNREGKKLIDGTSRAHHNMVGQATTTMGNQEKR